jgi:hypothetical protein
MDDAMKGLILSLTVAVLYGVSTMVAAHVFRPRRHLYLFVLAIPAWILSYLLLYVFTPADLFFLPQTWTASVGWVDFIYGLAVFLFICHSFVCAVFAGCSGFSISLLVAAKQSGNQTPTTDYLVAKFRVEDGGDRIYGWRVPHLEKRGYIRRNSATGGYVLTGKGCLIAQVARFAKWAMNLGEGG